MARKFQIGPKEQTHSHARALARRSSSRPFIELRHSLPGQFAAISSSVDMVMRFVSKFRKGDGSEATIEMALREALTNAVVHGSHEDPNKRIDVLCHCNIDGEVLLTVRDQGQGFDSGALPDPTAPENLLSARQPS
jgi:serine/threonine-protein kinase RsbW